MTDEKLTDANDDDAFRKARGDYPGEEAESVVDAAADGGDDNSDDVEGGGEDDDELLGKGEDGGDGVDGDDESTGDEEDGDKGITIPKARFDEAQRKARQKLDDAEKRLADAEAKLKTQTTSKDVEKLQTEIDDLEDKYEDLLMEGEVLKARAIRKDLRAKQKALTEAVLDSRSSNTKEATVEQIRFETQLAAAEVKYPMLNPDRPEFDQDKANEVADLMGAFRANGYQAAAALIKALTYVMRDEGEPEPKIDVKVKKTQKATEARRKVAAALKKSPPSLKDAGRDSDHGHNNDDGLPDISKMSPEQFAELSEADLRKIRGDFLEESA